MMMGVEFDLEIFVGCFPQMATNPRACLHWQSRGVLLDARLTGRPC